MVGWRKRAFLAVAASLGLLAMLGTGEKADMLAHAAGLVFGLLLGLPLARWARRLKSIAVQSACLLATVALVASAWLLAFRH
jgi:membrane associated rhomboid family serine protease